MSNVVIIGPRKVDFEQEGRLRYHHVTKHLYEPEEHWRLIASWLPADPRAAASAEGCRRRDLGRWFEWERVCAPCREHVLGDHDRTYLPIVVAALETALAAGEHAVVATRKGDREVFVGDNGVQVFLRLPDATGQQAFVTGLRERMHARNPTNDDFYKKAVRKLRDKASLTPGDPA